MDNKGIYLQTTAGSKARAVYKGEVTSCFLVGGTYAVIIQHGNYRTVYSNLSKLSVKQGDTVEPKQAIGTIFTDPEQDQKTELYFQIYKDKNIPNAISSTETSFKTFISIVLNNQQSMKKVLPENLNFLPIYILGMIKQRVFCKDEIDKKYDIDLSNFLRIKLQRMSYEEILSYIYPNIYPIHNLMTDKSLGTYNEEGILNMPQIIGTSINSFEPNGLYLIDNGYLLIIYVKTNCDKEILKSLFEVEDLQFLTINVKEDIIFEKMDEFKERIMNIIDYIRATKSLYQNLIFVFEGTNTERIIKESLIEDNFCNWYPYDYTNFYNKCVNDGFRGGYK
jgi:hypothetical protein